jgi:hypothetical protein
VQAQQEAAKETEGAAEPSAAQPSAGASDEGPRAAEGDVLQAVAAPAGPHAEVDEKQVALMMIDLRAEEPPALEGAWAVNVTAGVVVAMVGVASAIWGAAALARKGMPAAGTLGGLLLLGFGLGFLGLGSWLIFKALRQRGVL